MHSNYNELIESHKQSCQNNDCCVNNKVANEKGKKFEIDSKENFIKMRIDNCLIVNNQEKKCDFGFIRNLNDEFYFVELKGSDVEQAKKQIINTITYFEENIIKIPKDKRFGFVVSSKFPKSGSDVNNLIQDFKKKYGKSLKFKNKILIYKPI
ncbi:hypothetical protein [Flavobacterium soli]|uniref:hypothetical protein n=1 Tax=Flavobacterium soli TaxID=344881 RepID=UPI0005536125|nr:hypothetical protein [Flavobacterium soli]